MNPILLDRFRLWAPTVLRLYTGAVFVIFHGGPKIAGLLSGSSPFADGVAAMGFPAPLLFAWLAALAEFGGGLLLLLGLFTRPAALAIAATMAVAVLGAHSDDPFAVKEKALTFLVIALSLALSGPGALALSDRFRRRPADDGR